MSQDLTNSSTQRQNILNNPFALQEIEKATHIQGIPFEGRSVVLKEQVAASFPCVTWECRLDCAAVRDGMRRIQDWVLSFPRSRDCASILRRSG